MLWLCSCGVTAELDVIRALTVTDASGHSVQSVCSMFGGKRLDKCSCWGLRVKCIKEVISGGMRQSRAIDGAKTKSVGIEGLKGCIKQWNWQYTFSILK